MTRILVGTSAGLHAIEDGRRLEIDHVGWDPPTPHAVTALGRAGSGLWAVVDDHEIWRTGEAVDSWSHVLSLGNLEIRCLADTRAGVLAGTSSAHLFRIAAPPTPMESVAAFDDVPGRDDWYTPWGGPPDTRWIAEDDRAVYVNVHVGGIVRSGDEGETWEPTIDIDADVHKVWAGVTGVFAACARGLAVSRDGGGSWDLRSDGLHAAYCRGVTVCGDTVLVSASTGPRGGRAAMYRGALDGGPLDRCEKGLPEWFDGNIDSAWLDATPDLVAFGTADGRVFASTDEGASWMPAASDLQSINCLQVIP